MVVGIRPFQKHPVHSLDLDVYFSIRIVQIGPRLAGGSINTEHRAHG